MSSPDIPQDSTLISLEKYSFSDEAAERLCSQRSDLRRSYVDTIDGVWEGIRSGRFGVVPFENSSAGVVWPHLERLQKEDWAIVGSINHQIRMCVGAVTKMPLEDIRIAYSHPKALEQSSEWLSRLPALEKRDGTVGSTVDAAMCLSNTNQRDAICLSSRRAIEELDLRLLAEDVANLPADRNITQFYVVRENGTHKLPDSEMTHHAALITPPNRQGVLSDILAIVRDHGVDLTSLHSRNIGHKQYSFFLEMNRQGAQDDFESMVSTLNGASDRLRWFGSWNLQIDENGEEVS